MSAQPSVGRLYQPLSQPAEENSAFWVRCGCWSHEFIAAVVTYIRPEQDQGSQSSSEDGGGPPQVPLITEELLAVDSCWRRKICSPVGMWTLMGHPCSKGMSIRAALTRLSDLLKEKRGHEV